MVLVMPREAMEAIPDDGLVARFLRDGDEGAFALLVRRHAGMVHGVCRRLLGHHQDAEDALQATFLVMARKLASVRRRPSLAGWLHGVAWRIANKARQRRPAMVPLSEPAAPHPEPGADLAWREVRAMLDAELDRLPAGCRDALLLCVLQGWTQEEAAEQLRVSKSTLRRRLEQGRALLARRLARRGLALSAGFAPLLWSGGPASAAAVDAAVRAGRALAAGAPLPPDLVSPLTLALMKGALQSMLLHKLRLAILTLVGAGMLAGAAGYALSQDRPEDRPGPAEPAAVAAAPEKPGRPPVKAPAKPQDIDGMQGEWRCTRFVADGIDAREKDLGRITLKIEGDKLVWHGDWQRAANALIGEVVEATREFQIKLDPEKSPRAIDLHQLPRGKEDAPLLGIYELKGDELQICVHPESKDRPGKFASAFPEKGPGQQWLILKRQEEEKK